MGLRESNKQEKREQLARAARQLFIKQGFEATTIRQIAERAGIAVGTVFLYAPDKRGLLFLLFSDAVLEVQREAFATLPPDGWAHPRQKPPVARMLLVDQLMHVFSRFYGHYAVEKRLSRLFIKELLFMDADADATADPGPHDGDKYRTLTFEFLARLAELTRQAQLRGELRADFDPSLVTVNFFATYFLNLLGLLDPIQGAKVTSEQAAARLRDALELQIKGLLPTTVKRLRSSKSRTASAAPPRKRRTRS